jgi:hypothetical protein
VKEAIDDGRVEPVWVPADKNVADLFTKHLDFTKCSEFSKKMMYGYLLYTVIIFGLYFWF